MPTSAIRSCKSSVSIKKKNKTALSLSFPSPSGESPLLLILLNPTWPGELAASAWPAQTWIPEKKCPRTVCFPLFLSIDIGDGQKKNGNILLSSPPPLYHTPPFFLSSCCSVLRGFFFPHRVEKKNPLPKMTERWKLWVLLCYCVKLKIMVTIIFLLLSPLLSHDDDSEAL